MAISQNLVEQLEAIARRENRSPDEVLKSLLDAYKPPLEDDNEYYSEANVRHRMYERARKVWAKIGDTEKLALTDEQLNEQFWLFDQDGIPRLKSEQGQIEIPENENDLFKLLLKASEELKLHSSGDVAANADDYVARAIQAKQDEQS